LNPKTAATLIGKDLIAEYAGKPPLEGKLLEVRGNAGLIDLNEPEPRSVPLWMLHAAAAPPPRRPPRAARPRAGPRAQRPEPSAAAAPSKVPLEVRWDAPLGGG
jgi:hypothetical protein